MPRTHLLLTGIGGLASRHRLGSCLALAPVSQQRASNGFAVTGEGYLPAYVES